MSRAGRFLERWSRLKGRGEAPEPTPPAASPAVAGSAPVTAGPAPDVALPPVEALDLASDFSAFLKKEVSESLRRAALRKLFNDPHFNRMDGLDIYIDDYSVSDPIAPEMMQRLRQFDTFLRDEPEAAQAASEVTQPIAAAARDAVDAAPPGGGEETAAQIDPPARGGSSPDSGA